MSFVFPLLSLTFQLGYQTSVYCSAGNQLTRQTPCLTLLQSPSHIPAAKGEGGRGPRSPGQPCALCGFVQLRPPQSQRSISASQGTPSPPHDSPEPAALQSLRLREWLG